MFETRPQRTSQRMSFSALHRVLVAIAIVSAIAAGCGGAKHPADDSASPNASTRDSSAPPPAVTPANADNLSPPLTAPGTALVPAATPTPVADGSALGAQLFAKRCVLCHGVDGHGDGVASKGLNPKPRNFHDQAYMKTRTDAQLLEVIRKGKGVMPRWEGQLSETEIQALLKQVRALGAEP